MLMVVRGARIFARRDRGDARAQRAGDQGGAAPRPNAAWRARGNTRAKDGRACRVARPRPLCCAIQRARLRRRARDAGRRCEARSRVAREAQRTRERQHYFTNYDKVFDWRLAPRWLDGREVLVVFKNPGDTRPGYFIELDLADGRVAAIRDFRYVSYIGREAGIELSTS